MGHNWEKALAHQKAARQFFSEFKKTESSGFITPYNENLQVIFLYLSVYMLTPNYLSICFHIYNTT